MRAPSHVTKPSSWGAASALSNQAGRIGRTIKPIYARVMSEDDVVDSFAQTMMSGSGDQRDVSPPVDVTFEGARYEIRRVLGAGGMGEVRLCGDAWIGRDVAMKVARAGAAGSASEKRGRFLREARVQGQLEHPNIVPVYDLGI